MNEKIKALAEQAGIWRQHYDIGEESPVGLEKFAELIIEECIDVIRADYVGRGTTAAVNNIEKHFGVEE